MPRGGSRVGSGRKPKPRTAVVLGMDGRRQDPEPQMAQAPAALVPPPAVPPPMTLDEQEDLLVPPSDLTPAQREFWRRYAPLAVEQWTLVPASVAGFRELCEQFALKQAVAKRLQRVGAASEKGGVLLRSYVRLAQRLDSSLARFKLTSFGKAAEAAAVVKKAGGSNPWAKVAGQ